MREHEDRLCMKNVIEKTSDPMYELHAICHVQDANCDADCNLYLKLEKKKESGHYIF